MNIYDMLQKPSGQTALFILIGFFGFLLLIFVIWFGNKVLRPIFQKDSSDNLRDYLKEIAKVGKETKPKDATWSKTKITSTKATIIFGKDGSPYGTPDKNSLLIKKSTFDPRSPSTAKTE